MRNENPLTYPGADLEYIAGVFPELQLIESEHLRQKVAEIWIDVWRKSSWSRIEDVPKNPEKIPAHRKLALHSRSVARQAVATAEIIEEFYGITFNRDRLIAAALLHDVSKLLEYEPKNSGLAGKSRHGQLIQHGIYGAFKAWEKGLSDDIVHNIIAHTNNSRTSPDTWEAILVHYVDYLDSDALLFEAGQTLFCDKN